MKVLSNNFVEKYTQNTLNFLNVLDCQNKNYISKYNNKFIKKLDNINLPQNICDLSINFIYRSNIFQGINIKNKNLKIELFTKNIIGYQYANNNLKSIINDNIKKLFNMVYLNCNILFIPSYNFSESKLFLDKLEDFILNSKLARI